MVHESEIMDHAPTLRKRVRTGAFFCLAVICLAVSGSKPADG